MEAGRWRHEGGGEDAVALNHFYFLLFTAALIREGGWCDVRLSAESLSRFFSYLPVMIE